MTGFDIFAFDSTGLFEVYYEFHNSCGYNVDTIRITNYDLPNSDFSLTENPDCGMLYYAAGALDSLSTILIIGRCMQIPVQHSCGPTVFLVSLRTP